MEHKLCSDELKNLVRNLKKLENKNRRQINRSKPTYINYEKCLWSNINTDSQIWAKNNLLCVALNNVVVVFT